MSPHIYKENNTINKSFKAKTIEIKINRGKQTHKVVVYSGKDIRRSNIPIDGYIKVFNAKKGTSNKVFDFGTDRITVIDKSMGYRIGYILTDDNHAIGVTSILPVLITGVVIMAAICYLVFGRYKAKAPSLADSVDYNGLQETTTEVKQSSSVIEGKMENDVSSKNKSIILGNAEENHCLMKYQVIDEDTNEIIFETEYIEPGKAVEFCAYDYFKGVKGTYKVSYNVETCKLDDENIKGSTMTVTGVAINML